MEVESQGRGEEEDLPPEGGSAARQAILSRRIAAEAGQAAAGGRISVGAAVSGIQGQPERALKVDP